MRKRTSSLIAVGVLAASLFCAASPAYAWGHRFRVFPRPHFFARPHFRSHFIARPFFPRVRVFPRARFYYSYPVGAYSYSYPYAYAYPYYPYRYYAAPGACYPGAAVVSPY